MGDFIWAKSIGGINPDTGKEIDLDAAGNVYIVGDYSGIVDFDPGVGVYSDTSLTTWNAFVLKLNSFLLIKYIIF